MPSTFRAQQLAVPVLAFLAACSMWMYVSKIVVPHQEKDAAQLELPRGNLSDLYPRWLGARELLLHGKDPYSRDVTLEIQRGYYGREIDPSRPNDPKDLEGFAYPVYVVLILAPSVHADFAQVRIFFLWLLTGLTILSVPMWQRVAGIELPRWALLAAVLLTLGSYPFMEGIFLQQLTLLVAFLLAGSFLARQRGWLFLSGVLLAIATIKPQLVLPPSILMVMWALGDWRERRRWLWGFGCMMAVLMGLSELLLSGWLIRFYGALRAYKSYMGGTSFLDLLLTQQWGSLARTLIILVVIWVGWKTRRLTPDAMASRRALCLALAAAVCTAPNLATYNQVLLMPAVFFVFGQDKTRSGGGMLVHNLRWIVRGLLIWPWAACGILILVQVVLRATPLVQRAWQVPLYATLSLPVLMLALLLAVPAESRLKELDTPG